MKPKRYLVELIEQGPGHPIVIGMIHGSQLFRVIQEVKPITREQLKRLCNLTEADSAAMVCGLHELGIEVEE